MIKFLYRLLTGEYFNLYVGGGSPAPAQQPTQQTVTQTNLPAWAQPYSEQLLGKAQALTDTNTNPYQSYTGDRLAGFTPMQQQAFQNIGGMQVSPQTGQATGLAGLAGMGSLGAGANYMNMATSPAAMQAFMSPYQQNVTDWQKQQAIMDYGRALPGMGAQAAQAGAFGGSRQALQQSEAQRNLQNTLAGIQAQGSQNAFNAAQQAQQFGAGLGLQGYGQATNAAQALNQFGQQQYQQQMGINAAQQQAGAQQQAMNQQQLTNQYQDFLNRQNYPYQQLAFMSDILHGTPTGGITTAQTYQAAPSMFSQIAGLGLGLGALGQSGLFGKKEGGEIKGYKGGGKVGYADGGLPQLAGMDVDMADPTTELGVKSQLQKAQMGQQPIVPLQTLMALQKGIQQLHTPAAQPQTTTVAQDLAKQVLAQSEPGVAGLPTDENMFTAANGGIVAFDDGGKVDPYNIASGETWLGQGIQRGKAALKDLTGILTLQPWQTDPERVARGDYRTNAEVEGYTPSSYAVNERADELRKRLAQQGVAAAQPVPPATRQFDPMNPWARVGLPAAQTAQTPPATGIPSTLTAADYEDQRPYPGVKSVAPAPAPARTVAAPTVKAPVATPTTPTERQPTALDKLITGLEDFSTSKSNIDPVKMSKEYMAELNEKLPSQAKDIREFYKAEGERLRGEGDKDRWLALAMGGFAAAGKSPYAIQNFGEGLGLAAKEISAVNKEMRAAERERQKAERAELAADRAQELGKLKEQKNMEMEATKLHENERQHKINAANVVMDYRSRQEQIASQENIHAMDRASRERVARMEAGTRNQTNALLNEYNARILRGDKAGAEALLPSIQAISEAMGKGAAQQRALTAQQKLQLDAAKASVKSLDEQILFEKDKTRKQTLINQRDNAMRTISNLEGGAEGSGMGGGFDLSAIKAELDKRGAR